MIIDLEKPIFGPFESGRFRQVLLYSDIFSHTVRITSKDWLVHYIFLRGHRSEFTNYGAFLFQRIVFTLTKCVDPDEMLYIL